MNILVLSWRDPKHPLAGGAEQVMHEHMKAWVKAGHKVSFFSSHPKGTKNQEILDGINIIRRGSQYLTVHIRAFFWYLFAKHPKFDLVVDQFHGWPFFTPLYVKVPKVAVIQELTREVWFRYHLPLGLNLILGVMGYISEPLFFLFYRKVPFVTGSESAKNELQTVGINSKNITVIPHGVIIYPPKSLPKKESVPTIMFLGALASDKGIVEAIKAFSILNKHGNYQFWVVGRADESYQTYLEKLVQDLGLRKSLKFFGFVSQEKKFELLARANIMVNPSVREGWGLVNIEANAMGTPVVAYNSQGLIDSVKHDITGIICEQNTPEQLAKEVEKLVSDTKKYNELSNNAAQWSKEFSWKKSAQKSLELIESL